MWFSRRRKERTFPQLVGCTSSVGRVEIDLLQLLAKPNRVQNNHCFVVVLRRLRWTHMLSCVAAWNFEGSLVGVYSMEGEMVGFFRS